MAFVLLVLISLTLLVERIAYRWLHRRLRRLESAAEWSEEVNRVREKTQSVRLDVISLQVEKLEEWEPTYIRHLDEQLAAIRELKVEKIADIAALQRVVEDLKQVSINHQNRIQRIEARVDRFPIVHPPIEFRGSS